MIVVRVGFVSIDPVTSVPRLFGCDCGQTTNITFTHPYYLENRSFDNVFADIAIVYNTTKICVLDDT